MVKAKLGKYLKEKCLSEHYKQLSSKYFIKVILNFQVIIKSILYPDDNFSKKLLSIKRVN